MFESLVISSKYWSVELPTKDTSLHSRTKTNHPQTNGICEHFHKTILQEFYQAAFRSHACAADLAPVAHPEKKQAAGKDQINAPFTAITTSKKLLTEIVADSVNRHPTSEERIKNLKQIYQKTISKPADTAAQPAAIKP
jgi:hypothetical protein